MDLPVRSPRKNLVLPDNRERPAHVSRADEKKHAGSRDLILAFNVTLCLLRRSFRRPPRSPAFARGRDDPLSPSRAHFPFGLGLCRWRLALLECCPTLPLSSGDAGPTTGAALARYEGQTAVVEELIAEIRLEVLRKLPNA